MKYLAAPTSPPPLLCTLKDFLLLSIFVSYISMLRLTANMVTLLCWRILTKVRFWLSAAHSRVVSENGKIFEHQAFKSEIWDKLPWPWLPPKLVLTILCTDRDLNNSYKTVCADVSRLERRHLKLSAKKFTTPLWPHMLTSFIDTFYRQPS